MAWPTSLQVGLKEWAVVCRALEQGRQTVLLRKGGIYEAAGEFELEHRQFLLFPTYLHQNLKMLKPSEHAGLEPHHAEPDQISITAAAEVIDIIQLRSRSQIDAIDDEHVWMPPLIDMRFSYRPENPLYLLLVRAYHLSRPAMLANTPAYAGCKSWVPLDQPVEVRNALPVLDDSDYERRRTSILDRINAAASRS
ncbi:MAG TPA: DUF1802 family protein [Tepidisphaeraceae bacterium]|nr:DUF1802 family protein [Tepidisphaeraceae bacterium]